MACTRVSTEQLVQPTERLPLSLTSESNLILGKVLQLHACKGVLVKKEAINAPPLISTLHELDTDVSQGAVKVEIKFLKDNKSSGANGLPDEVLKYSGEALAAVFHATFKLC